MRFFDKMRKTVFLSVMAVGVLAFAGCATEDEKKDDEKEANDGTHYFYTFDLSTASDDLSDFEAQGGAAGLTKAVIDAGDVAVYLIADAATAAPMAQNLWGTAIHKMTKNTSTGLYEANMEKAKTTYNEWDVAPELLNTKVVVVLSANAAAFEADPDSNPFYGYPKGMGNLAVDHTKLVNNKAVSFLKYDNNALTAAKYDTVKIMLKK